MGKAEDFANTVNDNSVHLLHIDCDPHGYEQTVNLFNLYKNKVKIGGAILFHDCGPHFGVLQAVQEIEKTDERRERP